MNIALLFYGQLREDAFNTEWIEGIKTKIIEPNNIKDIYLSTGVGVARDKFSVNESLVDKFVSIYNVKQTVLSEDKQLSEIERTMVQSLHNGRTAGTPYNVWHQYLRKKRGIEIVPQEYDAVVMLRPDFTPVGKEFIIDYVEPNTLYTNYFYYHDNIYNVGDNFTWGTWDVMHKVSCFYDYISQCIEKKTPRNLHPESGLFVYLRDNHDINISSVDYPFRFNKVRPNRKYEKVYGVSTNNQIVKNRRLK